MKKLFSTFLIPAIALAAAIAIPAVAQDKAKSGAPTMKVLIDNDRVKV